MRSRVSKLPMQKRMMIFFAVPLLIVQMLSSIMAHSVLLQKFRIQYDYSVGQSLTQAVSFVESYIRNMKYLAEMVENNGQIYTVLSSDKFGRKQGDAEQYKEFYALNKAFDSLEVTNSVYRFGLYVSDNITYANNNYYIFPESRLRERKDYEQMLQSFEMGKDYITLSEERLDIGATHLSAMVTLYHQIRSGSDTNSRVLGVCSISVAQDWIVQVMENASLTPNGLVYLVSAQGEAILSSDPLFFEELKGQEGFPLAGGMTAWERIRIGGMDYYMNRKDVENTEWQMVSLIRLNEYDKQYYPLILTAVAALAVMVLMIVIVSYILSNYYVGKLKKLSLEMQHLQDGDLNVQIPSDQQGDEIEEVYSNFNFMVGEVRRLVQEHYQLGKDARVAEIRALQAQINPHFLYNTLDLINWIAMDYGANDIEKIAWNLARFYRLSLNHGKDLISIAEEVEHVQVYVNIEKFHYDDAIHLETDIPEALKNLACMNIILQPFVENAIVHGIGENPEIQRCSIVIRAEMIEEDILFSVTDDGPGMTARQMQDAVSVDMDQIRGGYGIKNINFKLKLCFGEKYGVCYESVLGEGTTAFIRFPAMTMEEAKAKMK